MAKLKRKHSQTYNLGKVESDDHLFDNLVKGELKRSKILGVRIKTHEHGKTLIILFRYKRKAWKKLKKDHKQTIPPLL